MAISDWFRRMPKVKPMPVEEKASAVSTMMTAGGLWPTLKTSKNYEKFIEESYLRNVVAYRCAKEVAMALGQVPWELFRETPPDKEGGDLGREKVLEHPVVELIKRPNNDDSFGYLVLKWGLFLQLNGNSYFERLATDTGPNMGIPQELYIQRPDRMQIKIHPTMGTVGSYVYSVGGRSKTWTVNPVTGQCDILHCKLFNPIDDWYGASIIESIAYEIDSHNDTTEWNMNLVRNQGRPGMVLTIISDQNIQVGDEQLTQMKRQLSNQHEGPKNTGRNLVLTGGRGTSAAPYGYSPSELDWDKGKLSLARDICMGFGVPPMLVGIPGEATFANYREARESFWEDTVKWYLELLKAELNGWLFPDTSKDKLFLDYDMDVVPAMAYKRDKLWDRAIAAGDFLTVDERREMVGQPKYEPGDTPGGVIMTDSTKIPLGTEIDTTEMDLETGPKPPPAPKPVKPAEKPTKKEDSTEYMEG